MGILDSRMIGGARRRRRICTLCGNRMTTYEIGKEDFEMLVEKEEQKGKII